MSSSTAAAQKVQQAQQFDESAALLALEKQERLLASLRGCGPLLVAFSGGADSAYLAWAANQALGPRALAVTALSASFSRHDREQAEACVRAASLRHEFIATQEFDNPLYVANNADRCYHCKDELFARMESFFHRVSYRQHGNGSQRDLYAHS